MAKKDIKRAPDFTLLLATLLLVFVGIIMVFSSSWPEGIKKHNDGYLFLKKQLVAAGLGTIAMLFFMNFNYKRLDKMSRLIFIMAILSGLLIFTPLGINYKGARRWVQIGSMTFMPSDVIKLGSIIYLSSFLSREKDKVRNFWAGLVPALFIVGLSCAMIYLQKDLSTTVTLGATLLSILFIAGMKIHHLFALTGLAILGLVKAITSEEHKYRMRRFTSFKDPFADPLDTGYQAVQSLYALGSGGLFGLGLGKSRQKFFYIPEPYNDFIFAIIGEELGFLGSLVVIILFFLLIWRGIRTALNVEDLFGSLLASGIVALITIQTLIHIGVVTSSIPPTGIPLPLVSYGGTSLIIYMSAIGILLNVSRHVKSDRS